MKQTSMQPVNWWLQVGYIDWTKARIMPLTDLNTTDQTGDSGVFRAKALEHSCVEGVTAAAETDM
jgi:hypothetical protein